MTRLPELTQQPVKFIDATPDESYPLRILQAYRQDCDCMWAESTTGLDPESPLMKAMNDLNRQRARVLDKAIKVLETRRRENGKAYQGS